MLYLYLSICAQYHIKLMVYFLLASMCSPDRCHIRKSDLIIFNFRYCYSCQRGHCLEKLRKICTYDLKSRSNIIKRSLFIFVYLFCSLLSFILSYFVLFIHTCLKTSPCLYTQTAEDRHIDLFYPVSSISVVRDMGKKLCLREVMYVIKGTAAPSFSWEPRDKALFSRRTWWS